MITVLLCEILVCPNSHVLVSNRQPPLHRLQPFAQYKGELVISLKFVTPQKPATEKKGKSLIRKLHLVLTVSYAQPQIYQSVFSSSVKKREAANEHKGELHILIKEAKNLDGNATRRDLR